MRFHRERTKSTCSGHIDVRFPLGGDILCCDGMSGFARYLACDFWDNVVSYTILRGLPPVLFHGGTAFECKQSHKVTQNKTRSAQCISQQTTSARNPCIGCVQQTDVCSIALLLPLYFCILHTLLSQTRTVFPWKIPMAFHGES